MVNKNNGFTLIELMIVIAIIGILSSVVLEAVQRNSPPPSTALIEEDLSNTPAVLVNGVLMKENSNGDYVPVE